MRLRPPPSQNNRCAKYHARKRRAIIRNSTENGHVIELCYRRDELLAKAKLQPLSGTEGKELMRLMRKLAKHKR